MEENNTYQDIQNLVVKAEALKNSYLSKEEFLKLLEYIDFKFIMEANLRLITDVLINTENNTIETRSKNINID